VWSEGGDGGREGALLFDFADRAGAYLGELLDWAEADGLRDRELLPERWLGLPLILIRTASLPVQENSRWLCLFRRMI
jgi:hypothetical protein